MADRKSVARRTFLVGSAAVAGGVVFGTYYFNRPPGNPLQDGLETGEAAITPFVKIDASGVTLITPRADVGQGIDSMQANLIAEELDVDPHSVKLEPASVHRAYTNGALLADAPATDSDHRSWVEKLPSDVFLLLAKINPLQMTGGSTSVPDVYDKLRMAGAVARETLKKAAAQQFDVRVEDLRTEDGAVILPGGERVSYTRLATAAAEIEPVEGVALRDSSQWRYLGKSTRRTDIVSKSTGEQKYGIDLRFDDMLYATVRANPGLGRGVKAYDDSDAVGMRGVKKIVPINSGIGVIADNTWRAFRAAQALNIEWEDGPFPASTDAMWKVLEDSFTEERFDSRRRDDGNVDVALRDADVIAAEYRTPYMAHAPLEPMNAVAKVTDDRIDVWTATQIPDRLKEHVVELTNVPNDSVFVHNVPAGGSFGRRLEDTYALQAVELARAVKGTPVKMTWTREEDMTHDYPRPIQIARGRGTVRDGHVDAFDLDIASQSVSASWFGRVLSPPPGSDGLIVVGAYDQPFKIPNYRVTGYRAPEMVPVSSWRSPGACTNSFFHEAFLDELIHAAGADPLEERLRLCEHEPSRKVLEAVGEMASWNGTDIGEGRGRGVAFAYSHGVPTAEVVDVTSSPEGIRIDQVYVACDVGRVLDPINFEAQVTGGVVWALGHAMNCELTYENFTPQQTNFHTYRAMRLYQTPTIEVRGLENGPVVRGIGEPSVPPAAPALANAIFVATGKRLREMPFEKSIDFA